MSKNFGKGEDKDWPDNAISDDEIKDFLNHLVFAVDQPNEEELGNIIKDEIDKEFDFITTENVYNKFFITMLNWLQGKERDRFLSYEEGKEFFEEVRRGIPIWFDIREPVESFTGRVEQLNNLHRILQGEGKTLISQVISINGLGGVGKSELARKYINEYSQKYDNKVVWINAESYQTLVESFRRLACDKLRISTKNANGEEKEISSIVEDVYKFFSNGKSLFVFDNVEKSRTQGDSNEGIDKFLPSLPSNANKPYVLITSRNQKWGDIEVMLLDAFTEKEAKGFIRKALNIEDGSQENEIQKLVETLQCFPLALQQAVAYIKERDIALRNVGLESKISDYLEKYGEKTKKLLDFKFPEDSSDLYTKTTFTTWRVTTDKIAGNQEYGEQAIDILNIMAYFAPENISTRMFLGLVGNNEEKLGPVVQLLKQYSMVNLGQEQVVLNIHRLVQQVIRINLKDQNKEEDVLRMALELIRDSKDAINITSVWKYASKYSKLDSFYFESVYGENKSRPLHLLADSGESKAIEDILKYTNRRDIDCNDIYGRTPLYRAAESGHMEVVKLLVENGADIKFSSASAPSWHAEKWTILHGAVYGGNKDVVEFLIDQGADINARDSIGRSPFYIAINEGHGEVAKLLDKTDKGALSIAASLGDREVVKKILEDKSEEERVIITNPAKKGERGPLHLAANCGYLEVVKLLVENGADISSSANDGFTPLHMAASEGYSDVVEFLVEEAIKKGYGKFDILKVSDTSGWTVLHSTAKSGHTKILRCLINKFSKDKEKSSRALINAADTKGTTLLQTAAFHGKLDTVKFLIEKKANVNAVDIFGATPLIAAAIQNNYEVVKYLLELKETRVYCDLEKVLGMLDITSLHAAAIYDNLDIAKLLLAKGSRVNAGEKGSLTPLHVAAFFDSSKVIEHLVDNGASTDVVINFSNIVNVLDLVKKDLKGGYGSQSVDRVITCCKLFKIPFVDDFIGSQFTPRMISTALKYNNKLVQRDVSGQPIRSIRAKILSLPLLLPFVEKQLRMIKDYVENKKSGQSVPPIGESSIFYDISNEVNFRECLPSTNSGSSSRSKREAKGECLFTWEDVDEFNTEKDKKRDLSKIKIDSKKFVNYIKDLPEAKQGQLIQLADKVQVIGQSQSLVNNLISNQKVMNHLNRVGRVSGMAMHGMMAKNVLADFLNGDYQGAAINVGFIAGGQGFAKVAEAASLKGLKLASEGKLLLGRSLRAASPFLARGTSAFVIYDLANQVKAFKNGTEEALVSVVGDSIYLGVDSAEIGIEIAEAFEVLEGVSSVTGPIGAAIGAVVFVGTDIYTAVKRVDKIDEIIHLTGREKFIEGLRAFIGMQPEQYIQGLMEEKQLNNQLVKQGLEYLKQHSDVQEYVFPTKKIVCHQVINNKTVCVIPGTYDGICIKHGVKTFYTEECTPVVELDNRVVLDKKRADIKWGRARPDDLNNGQLFCLPEGDYQPAPSYGSYLCENAIGITDLSASKTGNHTLINLGEGTDHAKGFIGSPNIFVVNNGSKRYFGGNKDDIFILQGNSITGYFYGEGGINTLDLTSFAPKEGSIDVKLHIGQVEDYYRKNFFGMSGINKFLGRKDKADQVFITCDSNNSDIKFVDGQSGSEGFVDHINIHDKDCAYEMQVVVRSNTVVHNRALEGDFHYIVPYALGSAKVDFIYTAEALNLNNTFAFEYEPAQIKNVDVRNINVLNKTSHIITFNFSPMSDKEFNITISGASNPSYRLGNNTEIKVGNRGNLYMLENTNKSVDEIIKNYLVVANRLNKMSFFIQSLLSNETVAIGSENYEVIHNNPLHKSHLVGNGGENVYVIDSESKRFELDKLFLPEVVIYDLNVESSVDTIDLRNLVQQARGEFSNEDSFKLQVLKSANDLLLKATIENSIGDSLISEVRRHDYFTVRLKDGVNWYNKTHVIMDNVPMRINFDNNEWSLKPQPLMFKKDKEIIVVTSQDVEENTELITPKRAGNYKFVRGHDSDLIITNAFNTQGDLCTIVLSKFYETPKMETLSIKFADKEIVLKDKQKEINTARDIDVVKREHKKQVYSDVFNRTKNSPELHRHRHEHSRHQVRHRRSTSSSARLSSRINSCISWVKKLAVSTFESIIPGLPTQYNIADKNNDANVKGDNNNTPQGISAVSLNNFLNSEHIALASCIADALDDTPSRCYQDLISKGVEVVPSSRVAVEFALKKFNSFVEDKIRNLESKEQARIRVELKDAYPEIIASLERGVEFSGNIGLGDVLEKCKECFCTNILPKDKVTTCLSDVGIAKFGNNLSK